MVARGTRRGFGGPEAVALIVIGLGVWFLLENMGLLPRGLINVFWRALSRYWPVLLVLAGLELLLRRRAGFGWLIAGLVVVLALGYLTPPADTQAGGPPAMTPGPNRQSTTVPLPTGGGTASISIENPVSNLRLFATDDANALLTAVGTLPPETSLNVVDQGNGRVSVSASFQRDRRGPNLPHMPGDDWGIAIGLSPKAPLDLRVSGGATSSQLDLSRLQVRQLTVESGVGETTLQLPAQGETRGTVRSGAGSITIDIPAGTAARIQTQSGLGTIHVDETAYPKSGNYYLSPGWDTATNRLDLRVEVGLGSIDIRRAP